MSEFTIYDEAPDTPERQEALRSLSAMYDKLCKGPSTGAFIFLPDLYWEDFIDEQVRFTWTSHMEGDIEE